MTVSAACLSALDLSKGFAGKDGRQKVQALVGISLDAPFGALTALVGPDGAGKTTFMRLAAGLMKPDSGTLTVLGLDVAAAPQAVQDRISYMPQRFGLYEDLSVAENFDLYADLHGVSGPVRRERYDRLMRMTDLAAFADRLAGQLSGGMKQKLGLACTLVRSPELLLLDEPTVGVDPLSRRELWEILRQLVEEDALTVIVSTAYMDEAERCGRVYVFDEGRILARGTPDSIRAHADSLCFLATPAGEPARILQARLLDDPATIDAVPQAGAVRLVRRTEAGAAILRGARVEPVPQRLEDGFMVLLRDQKQGVAAVAGPAVRRVEGAPGEMVVEVRELVRRFGAFTAVDRTSFSVKRGELFGLLGPNGAGKTTTFRMLCGLLPATSGFLEVAGYDLRHARATARNRIGYVAQKFALYGSLTVKENLDFFAGAYGLYGARRRERIEAVMADFELAGAAAAPAGQLSGGFRQRLAMAAALMHEPDILFLDEPTSGADPLARRAFWRRITALAERGVTVIVTTHFMEEAEYCDRIVIQDVGRVLALGTPREVRLQAGEQADAPISMENAFIAIVEQGRAAERAGEAA